MNVEPDVCESPDQLEGAVDAVGALDTFGNSCFGATRDVETWVENVLRSEETVAKSITNFLTITS